MSLHTKYRPKTFDEVLGQSATVKSLRRRIEKGDTKAFLLAGPSGCGKTTLARIAAREAGCSKSTILEIDAARYTGVEEMRNVTASLQYLPLGETTRRAVILDEAHRLSKQAWESLLKSIEEPPPHVLWFLCTTEPTKLPQTIKTRCVAYTIKPVPDELLGKLYDRVAKAERIKLDPGSRSLIIREAHGSPRQMLVNLAACESSSSKAETKALLEAAEESDAIIKLARYLCFERRKRWADAMQIVSELKDENPEGVRIIVCNYVAAVLKNPKGDPVPLLQVLEHFSTPFNQSEKLAPLILAIGRVLYA